MRATFRRLTWTLTLSVLLLLGSFVPTLLAQATVNSTTLSAAVTATTNRITVASASTIAVGQIVYVDKEAMTVTAISGTALTVQRGQQSTSARTHASGAVAWTGPNSYFSGDDPAGPCVATSETLPRIVAASGNIYSCDLGFWRRYTLGGLSAFAGALAANGGTAITYTSTGALTITPGLSFIGSGGALAMTLANPTKAQNGMIMIIEASTAQAHTVTYTAGFGGGTTARDVATFGGAIADNLVIIAVNEVWWVISTRNVTIA